MKDRLNNLKQYSVEIGVAVVIPMLAVGYVFSMMNHAKREELKAAEFRKAGCVSRYINNWAETRVWVCPDGSEYR